MRALLLHAIKGISLLSYNDDWKDSFLRYDKHINWDIYNLYNRSWVLLIPKLKRYDLIVILHSTNSNTSHFPSLLKKALLYRRSKLLIFIGNEYKLIPQKLKLIEDIDADYIASQLPQDIADWLYAEAKGIKLSVPHALNPFVFKPILPQKDRLTDIGERSYEYPWYLGDLYRNRLIQNIKNYFSGLTLDISSDRNKRFSRKAWAEFLNKCKGTVSTEAGTSFLERDDRTRLAVNKYLIKNKGASFNDVYNRFFENYKNPVSGKTISSRHFDAIGTKTCQIMLSGRFCDILKPDIHYISINRDFSNLESVYERFIDIEYRKKMTDLTYEFAMDSHTHLHRISSLFNKISLI